MAWSRKPPHLRCGKHRKGGGHQAIRLNCSFHKPFLYEDSSKIQGSKITSWARVFSTHAFTYSEVNMCPCREKGKDGNVR
jgi:hypothetical protein